jgi:phage terminase small subunit
MGTAEKKVFVALVAAVPATQFMAADLSLICRWCEWTVAAERAAAHIAAEGEVTNDGKLSPWVAIREKATKALTGLALRLRLGPQSRAFKAPKRTVTSLSYYDRQSLEGNDGQGEAGEAH